MSKDSGLIKSITDQIAATRLSEAFKDHMWVVPTSQSIHILAVSIVFVCALLISLRLLGIGRYERPFSAAVKTQIRLMYVGLLILLLTGTVQTIAEPDRQFHSPAFWIKMLLIVFALLLTHLLSRSVRRDPQRWNLAGNRPAWSRLHAAVYVAAWAGIIFCGRFIGYT
jgi:hypothetical protein